jgi:hypothetical protein
MEKNEMKIRIQYAGLLLFAGMAWGQQVNSLVCNVTAAPPIVRIEGVTERPSDVVIECTGGTPTAAGAPVPQANIQVFYNTDVTSRVLATGFSEVLLQLDEPGLPANPVRLVCDTPTTGVCSTTGTGTGVGVYDGSPGRPNIFQARQTGLNSVVFLGVPVDPPGLGNKRSFRVSNVRLNASGLGPLMVPPTPLYAFVAITGTVSVPINNPQSLVGVIGNGLTFGVSTNPAFSQCVPENAALAGSPAANGVPQFSVTFAEGFVRAFQPRSIAGYVDANTSPSPVAQNLPPSIWDAETGFYDPSFPTIVNRGNLGVAGLADQGTRLRARFAGVPTGVKLFARAVVTSGQLVARLVTATAEGEGAFTPVAANSFGIAPVPVSSGGVATLVYEILRADPFVNETVSAPIYVAYDAPPVGLGPVTVSGALAPLTAVLSADATASIPRFVEDTPLPAFTFTPCTGGRMTGGGSVFTSGKERVTHGFTLRCDAAAKPNNLEVNWKGNSFHLESLSSAVCTDDPAIQPQQPKTAFDTYTGAGTGRLNGVSGATATWVFTDAGEPGKNDRAQIVIKNNLGATVLTVSGNLDKGNQQAH